MNRSPCWEEQGLGSAFSVKSIYRVRSLASGRSFNVEDLIGTGLNL